MANDVTITVTGQDKASSVLKGVTSNVDIMKKAVLAGVGAFAGFAGAQLGINALKGAVLGAVTSTAKLGEAVHDMSEQTGMSAENSSRMLFALKSAGVESDKASTAMGRFAKNMFAIQVAEDDGSKSMVTNQKILASLGVTATDVGGQVRPVSDIMMDLADKISVMGAGTAKTAAVLALFGKGGLPMLDFLNLGSKGIKELYTEADKLGLTLSGSNVAAIHAFTIAQRQMGEAMGGLKLMIGNELMPVITRLENWVINNQPKIREFAATVGTDLTNAFDTVKGAIGPVMEPMGKLFGMLSNKDIAVIFASLSAAIVAGFVAIGVAAMAAFVAENLALLGIPILVAGAVAALAILVAHWNQVWGAMQAAPAALLNWLGNNWKEALVTVLLGPAGPLVLLIRHWGEVWAALPLGAQQALDRVANVAISAANAVIGAFETAINKIIDSFNKLPGVIGGILGKIPAIGKELSGVVSGLEVGDISLGRIAERAIPQSSVWDKLKGSIGDLNKELAKAAAYQDDLRKLAAATDDLNTNIGTTGGAAAAATTALTAEEQAMIALAAAFDTSGLSADAYNERLLVAAEAMKDFNLTAEQLNATFIASGLSADSFAEHLAALTQLKDLEQQAKDATDAVDALYNAFSGLFSHPTKEAAAQNLALAQLKEQRAKLIEQGASSDDKRVKAIDDQIAAIQREIDLRRAHEDVMKAELDAANQALQTDAQQELGAQMVIGAMVGVSSEAANMQAMFYLSSLALQKWTEDMANWMAAATGSGGGSSGNSAAQDAIDELNRFFNLTPDQQALVGTLTPADWAAIGNLPSYDTGGIVGGFRGQPQLALVHGGEEVLTAAQRRDRGGTVINNYGHVHNNLTATDTRVAMTELDRLFR